MKIRRGFVSNSSSSSFIIGVARVKDPKKLGEWVKKNGRGVIQILSTEELLGKNYDTWSIKVRGDRLSVEAPVNSEPEVGIKFNKDKSNCYLIVCEGNDEGDSPFWDGDELNYDIVDFNYFEGDQRKALELLMNGEDMLEDISFHYGAERNG